MREKIPDGLALVAAFANTVDVEAGTDELADVDGLRRWLAAHGHDGPAGDAELAHVRDFRAALRDEIAAHHDQPATTPHRETATRHAEAASRHEAATQPGDGKASQPAAHHDGAAPAAQRDGAAPATQPGGDVRTGEQAGARARLNAHARGVPVRVALDLGGVRLEAAGASGVESLLGALLAELLLAERDGVWRRLKICDAETCREAFYDWSKNSSRRWCSMGVCGNRSKTRAYRVRRRES
ncbi:MULTISPECIES: CGNR zinc finger domain-containing protein [Catenuloplanes]|uniref:RNA-binding Zn ribbon-like protein n=1 Tax=Catenuloplanes niger TaxID=587534 RepID=A0AAE3ZUC2_9ACTN|nr:CGNR zinc finger domain-containing protein [Catenuloplanes niger]MDR7325142.1 putative RNA-binding Zn ribbon-like protein [Catenuloplanes niger]